MLRFLLNVLLFVLGGVVMGLGWWLAGLVAAITIVGLPWARACFVIGNYSFWPFGNEAVSRRELTGRNDFGTGPFGVVGNVIWFLVAGWWLAIGHLTSAVACFVTIIVIPFGIQHIKLALIALAPIGMQMVPVRATISRRGCAGHHRPGWDGFAKHLLVGVWAAAQIVVVHRRQVVVDRLHGVTISGPPPWAWPVCYHCRPSANNASPRAEIRSAPAPGSHEGSPLPAGGSPPDRRRGQRGWSAPRS
jgi:uncharacterized membrane protein YccF (DUF307 family)